MGVSKQSNTMREQLQKIAKLFELSGTGTDEAKWADAFEAFVKRSMSDHAGRLKSCDGEAEQVTETFRARHHLFEIVKERLSSTISMIDKDDAGIVEAFKALFSEEAFLFQEVLGFAREATKAVSAATSSPLRFSGKRSKTPVIEAPVTPGRLESPRSSSANGAVSSPASQPSESPRRRAKGRSFSDRTIAASDPPGSSAFALACRSTKSTTLAESSPGASVSTSPSTPRGKLQYVTSPRSPGSKMAAALAQSQSFAEASDDASAEEYSSPELPRSPVVAFPSSSSSFRSGMEPIPEKGWPSTSDKVGDSSPGFSARGAESPRHTDAVRQLRGSNSYALRHQSRKSLTEGLTEDATVSNRPSVASNKVKSTGKQDTMTLRQLMDIILEVYETKREHNTRCENLGRPAQTMEQYFYTYLAERYASKEAVQEFVSTVYRSIQKYQKQECQVAVFGKVLQNKLSESFPDVLDTLKQTILGFLREQFEAKNSFRPQAENEALWQSFVTGTSPDKGMVSTQDFCEVVQELYNRNDCQVVLERLLQRYENNGSPPDKIRLRDACQVIYGFQMNLTEQFLKEFIKIFREVDSQYSLDTQSRHSGVLNAAQLDNLILRLSNVDGVLETSVKGMALLKAKDKVLNQIDGKESATFSECVDLFSGLISARHAAKQVVDSNDPA